MEFPTLVQEGFRGYCGAHQNDLAQNCKVSQSLQQTGFGDEVILSNNARVAMLEQSETEKNALQLTESGMTPEETRQVAKLKQRDAEVRAHEAAHMSAGAGVVQGGAKYQYTTGPDGRRYITGGEVGIDVAPESDPRATIQKMQQVRQAALAPANPSPTDRAVAAQAAQQEAQARMALVQEGKAENEEAMQDTEMIWDDGRSSLDSALIDMTV